MKVISKELLKYKRPDGVSDEEFISKHQGDHLEAILVGIFGVSSYLRHGFNDPLVWMWMFLCLMKYKKVIKSYNDNEEDTYKEIVEYIKTYLKEHKSE